MSLAILVYPCGQLTIHVYKSGIDWFTMNFGASLGCLKLCIG